MCEPKSNGTPALEAAARLFADWMGDPDACPEAEDPSGSLGAGTLPDTATPGAAQIERERDVEASGLMNAQTAKKVSE